MNLIKVTLVVFSVLFSVPTSQLYAADAINMSARANVGTGANKLNTSVVVTGTGTTEFLAKALGPSMNVAARLMDPVLRVVNVNTAQVIAEVDDWGDDTAMANELINEAAVIVDLPAGAYTVQVTGFGGTTGVGQASLKRLDPPGSSALSKYTGFWRARTSPQYEMRTTAGVLSGQDHLFVAFSNAQIYLVAVADGPINPASAVVTTTLSTKFIAKWKIEIISSNELRLTFLQCLDVSSCSKSPGDVALYDRVM